MNARISAVKAAIFLCTLGCTAHAQAPAKRAITFKDLISMHRVSDPQVSPDGHWVAYTVATPDFDANRTSSDVWVVPASGGDARQLTRGGNNQRPRWSPEGRKVAFLSSRDGTSQIYTVPFEGGEPARVTFVSTGRDDQLWSPDGSWIAFVSAVYPDCRTDDCNAQRINGKDKSKVKARVYEKLLYRHWTAWSDGRRSHLSS
jgi:Tol biopolymer transport system component